MKYFRLPKRQLFGQVFGMLTVIAYAGRRNFPSERQSQWLCRCKCGKYTVVTTSNLKYRNSPSCRHHAHYVRHGHAVAGKASPEYDAYQHMKSRCYNPRISSYPHYGGRGICVCARWLESFENFIADMGPKPDPSYSLDRIDNNGNYQPGNCRWTSRIEQAQNRRRSNLLTFDGETLPMTVWARKIGIEHSSLRERLAKGMSVAEALTTPVRKRSA